MRLLIFADDLWDHGLEPWDEANAWADRVAPDRWITYVELIDEAGHVRAFSIPRDRSADVALYRYPHGPDVVTRAIYPSEPLPACVAALAHPEVAA